MLDSTALVVKPSSIAVVNTAAVARRIKHFDQRKIRATYGKAGCPRSQWHLGELHLQQHITTTPLFMRGTQDRPYVALQASAETLALARKWGISVRGVDSKYDTNVYKVSQFYGPSLLCHRCCRLTLVVAACSFLSSNQLYVTPTARPFLSTAPSPATSRPPQWSCWRRCEPFARGTRIFVVTVVPHAVRQRQRAMLRRRLHPPSDPFRAAEWRWLGDRAPMCSPAAGRVQDADPGYGEGDVLL
jgi:hypothetical protein